MLCLVLLPIHFLIRKKHYRRNQTLTVFSPLPTFNLILCINAPLWKWKLWRIVVVFLIINHTRLERHITAPAVHTLTSVTVSLRMLIKKPHPKICLSENNLWGPFIVDCRAHTRTHTLTWIHTGSVCIHVKTFQLNSSQTNSVGAELLVVDENCAANRLTLWINRIKCFKRLVR